MVSGRFHPSLRHRLHHERMAKGSLREEHPARVQRGLPQIPGKDTYDSVTRIYLSVWQFFGYVPR